MPVEIKGLDEVLKAMRHFEPDLAKNLNREVRAALTPVQKQARAYVPNTVPGLSNWSFKTKGKQINSSTSLLKEQGHFPKFNASLVRKDIKLFIGRTVPNRKGFSTFYRISNASAAGAIMETAGRVHPDGQAWNPKSGSHRYSHSRNPKAGAHFISSMGGKLEGKGKTRGRLIYRAWDEDQGRALNKVLKAVTVTCLQFKRRADAQTLAKAA